MQRRGTTFTSTWIRCPDRSSAVGLWLVGRFLLFGWEQPQLFHYTYIYWTPPRTATYTPPGLAAAFPVPVAGVVTKIDLATPRQLADGLELLELAGAKPIFSVSSVTGEGMEALVAHLGGPET